ncbi:MAG: HlyD family type I secretion periplasmic adaptor subunit [Hyphomicrobiaceae bacterium]|nr:MAG: HlyD family type I secretion periplasmic adaptor subunit [Hyphomicrobiaceae bacterium]
MHPTNNIEKNHWSTTPAWLTTPIEFEEQRNFRVSRNTLRVIVALAAVVLLWAAVAPMRELSLARGQLVPLSQVRSVQHLEGGIVDQIHVQEGEVVEKDQPLMRLHPAIADSELSALRVRAHNLSLLKERVEALLAGRVVDFSALGDVNTPLAGEHYQVYQLRLEHRVKERRLLLARIAHRKAEIASLQTEIVTQTKLMEIQEEQLRMRRVLALDGNMSKKQVLDVETAFEQSRVLLQASQGKLAAAQEALQEAEAALAESDAQAQKLWSEELAKASGELVEVQESIKKHADRVERLIVRAPTKGRVQHVLQRSVGEVVRPGEMIARIVPLGDALVAEVQVRPDDIAAVKVADRAELKVTAYDFSRYGKIKGEVVSISPTTFESDDKRSHYYKVVIRLTPGRNDKFATVWQLQPGMTVDAEIVSGSKSLMQYLLKPIYRGMDVAFSER